MTSLTNTCRFVLKTALDAPPRGQYCEAPVGWRVVKDDDQNLVRKYKTFCDTHQAWVDAHPYNDDEEL